jgi:hypothetical protein
MSAHAGSTRRHGRLNWLQQNWLRGDPQDPNTAHENNLGHFVPVEGHPTGQLLNALTALVARHESLRTVVAFNHDGPGSQTVHEPPRSTSEIEHVVQVVDMDISHQVVQRRRASPFDLRGEWPVHFVVSQSRGRARGVHIVIDHSATDGWGLEVLGRDISSGLTDGLSSSHWPTRERPVTQPLDTAIWEDSSDGARRSRSALRHWRDQLQLLSDRLDRKSPQEGGLPGAASRIHRLSSTRLRTAALRASAIYSVSVDTVFLCAYGWALARINETDTAGVLGMHVNRFTGAELRSAALRFTQSPVAVLVPEKGPPKDALKNTHLTRMKSIRVGHAHPAEIDAVVNSVLPDALSVNVCGALFNYIDQKLDSAPPRHASDSISNDGSDDILLKDLALSRGPDLMLTVTIVEHAAKVYLTSKAGSWIDDQAKEFLTFIADCVYWMASSERWSTFPHSPW